MARSTRHSALVDALVMRLAGWRNAHPLQVTERDGAGRTWYRVENKATDTGPATIHLYDEIGAWGVSADMFMADLAELGSRDLTLRINSPGGEVFDGVAIYNALQRHAGRITGHVDGLAASAASFIAMAADELVVEPGAQLMIHDAQGMCWGNAADARQLADMLDRTSQTIAMIYAERAGGSADDWRELMRAETWYDGAGAVEAKLADRVGESRARDDRSPPSNKVVNYDPNQARDPNTGRWLDGMPDAIASYAFATTAGALTATRTRESVELSDGAHSVSLTDSERGTLQRAVRAGRAATITRDGRPVARVRPVGVGQDDDGAETVTSVRLDVGEVGDVAEYDSRTGVTLSATQADEPFAATLNQAAVAERVQTGYGPLDLYPTSGGTGMGLRMKAESGNPTEVEFTKPEWTRINRAIDALVDGEEDQITVNTKAGKIDLEWKGGRSDRGYVPDARLLIVPQGDAVWSVVIDGEHMPEAFDPIGLINDAIGVNNIWKPRMRRRPERRPLAFRTRPHIPAPFIDFDADQPRDDDGRWAEFPGTGIEWSKYADMYDVYDESSTRSGIVVATMTGGDMQLAFDDNEQADIRHVLLDFDPSDNGPGELRDALQQALDATEQGDIELIDPETPTEVWANVSINAESITLFVPGAVERNDFEIEIDFEETQELIDALDAQIDRFNELQGAADVTDTWAGLVSAILTPRGTPVAAWDMPEWAAAHSTSEPVSSLADDHEMPWEAYA
ncbi:MAG: head maturation protease, ClpP-related [Actinoplanes sp.]